MVVVEPGEHRAAGRIQAPVAGPDLEVGTHPGDAAVRDPDVDQGVATDIGSGDEEVRHRSRR